MMKSKTKSVISGVIAVGLGCVPSASAATVVVDWLTLGSGATPGAFALRGDGGTTLASGSLAIESGKGIAFPGFPASRNFNAASWSAAPPVEDSVGADGRVNGFDIRVAPQGGMASYRLELSVPAGVELWLAVGGLFHGSNGKTDAVVISSLSDSAMGVVALQQIAGWGNGITQYNQDVEWDEPTRTLSTTTGSSGDSEIGFFKIDPISGPNPRVVLTVANGYNVSTGDSISVGLGIAVPEPGAFALLGLGSLLVLSGRRR